jgi:hypothetical protein
VDADAHGDPERDDEREDDERRARGVVLGDPVHR